MDQEIWKDIPGFEGYYQASTKGNIRSVDRMVRTHSKDGNSTRLWKGRMLNPILVKMKYNVSYYKVPLSKKGIKKLYYVHRLIAITFLPNPHNLPQVNHKDENGLSNDVSNLEWCSVKDNINYGNHNDKVRVSNSNQHILQYTKDGVFVKEFISQKEAERELNIDHSHISHCIQQGKICGGYLFKKKEN